MDKIIIYTQAYNAEKTLRRTIESVLGQTRSDFVYYVLNNGSNDRTGAIIAEYAMQDNRIIPFTNEVNNVFPDGDRWLHFLEHYSDDCYFCMLDADDEYKPDFLELILGFISKEHLDIAACGYDFVDAQSNRILDVRKLERNLIIEGNGFDECFPSYHQFMRTIWAKVYALSVLRKPDYNQYPLYGYGSDTLFVMKAFHNAKRVGILAESLHKYYISPKSVSYQFDDKRIASDQILFDATYDFLMSKCGTVSQDNLSILHLIYLYAIQDSLRVLFNTHISVEDKLNKLCDIVRSQHTKELFQWPGATVEKNELLNQITAWVLSQEEIRSGLCLDAAAEILAATGIDPSQIKDWPDGWAFMLLTKITHWMTETGTPGCIDPYIISITSKAPSLYGLDAGFLTFFVDLVFSILQHDEKKALEQLLDIISRETDIPDKYAEPFLTLGLNLSAKLEQTHDFVFLKKLHITLLIDSARYDEAREALSDWDALMPDEIDFKVLRARLTQ